MANELIATDERTITYTPMGDNKEVKLTIGMVRKFLTTPTRSGKSPSDQDVVKFMMLCEARQLNPWVGDAYLIGYDSKDGPQFSLITAQQALLKRAEINEQFNGLESGVIVSHKDASEVVFRPGDFVIPGETLLGGWARAHRKDREAPFYDALNLATYNTGRSQWSKDAAGMIVKCAEASVLRKAFPTQTGGLYTREEMSIQHDDRTQVANGSQPRTIEAMTQRIQVAADVQTQELETPHVAVNDEEDTATAETTERSTADDWSTFTTKLAEYTSLRAVRELYETMFGPDSEIPWSLDKQTEAAKLRDERVADIKSLPSRSAKQQTLTPAQEPS